MDESQEVLSLTGPRLAEAVLSLMSCRTREAVFDAVRDFVGKVAPDVIAIVSEASGDPLQMAARDIVGIGDGEIGRASALLGFPILGRILPIDERLRERFAQRKLARLQGGLPEFAAVALPKPMTILLAKAFGIRDVYTIGIADDRRIYGSLSFLTRSSVQSLPVEEIEAFVYVCFLTLSSMPAQPR
jgi:hypothetical protein